MWTLANHPRVPERVRNEVARWGTCKDEFVEGRLPVMRRVEVVEFAGKNAVTPGEEETDSTADLE